MTTHELARALLAGPDVTAITKDIEDTYEVIGLTVWQPQGLHYWAADGSWKEQNETVIEVG